MLGNHHFHLSHWLAVFLLPDSHLQILQIVELIRQAENDDHVGHKSHLFLTTKNSLEVERLLGCPVGRKLGAMVRINGLFQLLIDGIYWGYNPLILTSWDIQAFIKCFISVKTVVFYNQHFPGLFF